MDDTYLIDPRHIWNEYFAISHEQGVRDNYEPWLNRWSHILDTTTGLPILDLGCGSGYDSQYLTEKGFCVVAGDFSREGLHVAHETANQAELVELDIRKGIPFSIGAFQVIIANLSLHYFRWDETQTIVDAIRGRLKMCGYLLARVSSTNDIQYGVTSGEIVERNCRICDDMLKRFFDRDDLERLFRDGWIIQGLEEQVVHCYSREKVLWEIVVQKAQSSTCQ